MPEPFVPTHVITGGVSTCSMNSVEDYTNLTFVGKEARFFRSCMNEDASIYKLADGTSVWAPRTSVKFLGTPLKQQEARK